MIMRMEKEEAAVALGLVGFGDITEGNEAEV